MLEYWNNNQILRYNITLQTWDLVGEMKYNRSFHSASLVNAEDIRTLTSKLDLSSNVPLSSLERVHKSSDFIHKRNQTEVTPLSLIIIQYGNSSHDNIFSPLLSK